MFKRKYSGGSNEDNEKRGSPKSSRKYHRSTPIEFNELKEIAAADPVNVIIKCCEGPFLELLTDREKGKDWIDLELQAVATSLKVDDIMIFYKNTLKTELLFTRPQFLTEICKQRLENEILVSQAEPPKELIESLHLFLQVYNSLLRIDPLSRKVLAPCLKILKGTFPSNCDSYASILAEYDSVIQLADQCYKLELEESGQAKNYEYGARKGRVCVEERPFDDFRSISVEPTLKDIDPTFIVSLRRNKVSGGYEDADDYLDTQFRLLREDFISTFREEVRNLRKNTHLGGRKTLYHDNCKVYTEFEITHEELTREGKFCIVRLPVHQPAFRNSIWLKSKKLIYDSLICLSTDNFSPESTLFATVSQREDKNTPWYNGRTIKIKFLPQSQVNYHFSQNKRGPFTVIESASYYGAYQHVLRGLQQFTSFNPLPFQKYIVRCSTDVVSPMYLKPGVTYKLPTENSLTSPVVPLQTFEDWPPAEEMGFNQSQYEAYKTALTKEFVVIQGPPGTGKTYVGLRIVETLIKNLFISLFKLSSRRSKTVTKWGNPVRCSFDKLLNRMYRPILVVCYTNHALDQFLEGILGFCEPSDVVRVGSRSESKKLENCFLFSKRPRLTGKEFWMSEIGRVYSKKKSIQERYEELAVRCEKMQKHELMTEVAVMIPPEQFVFTRQLRDLSKDKLDPLGYHTIQNWLQTDKKEGKSRLRKFQKKHTPPIFSQSDSAADKDDGKRRLRIFQKKRRPTPLIFSQSDSAADTLFEDYDIDKEEESRLIDGLNDEDFDKDTTVLLETESSVMHILNKEAMTKDEVKLLKKKCNANTVDIAHDFTVKERWRLYLYWYKYCYEKTIREMKSCLQEFQELLEQEGSIKNQQDVNVLKRAKVIGMTTTAAARMQSVLQQVGPEIVVVEEAAEVLEAHIITALSEHCKHLILIGDHKQLKPSPTVYDLAKQYHLDLSLFERMVNNGLPVKTLNIQHRMRPEVSKYMRHIYNRLDDHPSVENRQSVKGMAKPVFFFNHQNPEEEEQGLMSKSNTFEADMVVALSSYLLKQDYNCSQITVITMYRGQEIKIKRKMKELQNVDHRKVKVTSVDNFQGEENDIIILSLVRSNKEGKSGFVKLENRVCVSLSRAKLGMYVFGNFDMICKDSEIWANIVKDAQACGEFGEEFNLSCVQHSEPALVKTPKDFEKKAPHGGCKKVCGSTLPNCSHKCKLFCHVTDNSHLNYLCKEKCEKSCKSGCHPCAGKCFNEPCPECPKLCKVELPCSHTYVVNCEEVDNVWTCKRHCLKPLKCGHKCQEICSEPCTEECSQLVEVTCSECEEIQSVPCHISTHPELFKCSTPCTEILDCGHKCRGTCSSCLESQHTACQEKCGVKLSCGHYCAEFCGNCEDEDHPPCKHSCDEKLTCGHFCAGICSDCHNAGEHALCNAVCKKMLDCGHQCQRRCKTCQSEKSHGYCNKKCELRCSHGKACEAKCYEPCHYPCKMYCSWGCLTCGSCRRRCGEPCKHINCTCRCSYKICCKMCREKINCRGLKGESCPELCLSCANFLMKTNRDKLPKAIHREEHFRWLKLVDCDHILPLKYMEEAARSSSSGRVSCPYTDCGKAILNTKRMIKIAWEVKCDKVQKKDKYVDSRKDGHSVSKKRPAVDASRAENFKRIKSGKPNEKMPG